MGRSALLWLTVATAIAVPLVLAANSPLLAWRDPIYIIAGFAGIAALGLLLIQPLLIAGEVGPRGRRIHRVVGSALVALVLLHVAGLWVTSPPDVLDALTFRSPTPFSVWGVVAMWAVFAAALIATLRRKLRPSLWRRSHKTAAVVVAFGTIVHAILIEGTMEPISKAILCCQVGGATLIALSTRRIKLLTGKSK